jgi:hypothetical protein
MTIFDNIVRTRTDVPHQDETQFAYLNVSAREEAGRVRALVDSWFDHYPNDHRASLVSRFRSPIDDDHRSAFFELFLHELIIAQGHRIEAIEPSLPHTLRRPDFLVENANGHRFYLEAVIATGHSQAEAAALNRLNQALRAVDTASSPGHFLDLAVRGTPDAPVSIKALRTALKEWIEKLPKNERGLALFIYEEHGLRISLNAFPKNNVGAGRAIGARHFPVQQVTVDEDIRAAILKKANRYGTLDLPYIVAVNSFALFHHEDNALDALLGTPGVVAYRKPDGTYVHEERRTADGVWQGPTGARKHGLSAVFATANVTPWNFASRIGCVIRNPWATRPLPPTALGVNEFNPEGGKFLKTEGTNLGAIFGLADGWPG